MAKQETKHKRVRFSYKDPAFGIMHDSAKRGLAADEPPAEPPADEPPADDTASPASPASTADPVVVSPARKRVAAAVVVLAAVAAGVVLWLRNRGAQQQSSRASEALAAEGELARYEAETRRYEAERAKLREEHQALTTEAARVLKAARQLREMSEQNSVEYRRLYSPQKESFDSEQASYEDEQSIESAFSLKNELDDKKKAMVQKTTQIGEQHTAALGRLRAIQQEIAEIEKVYSQSFDDPIT